MTPAILSGWLTPATTALVLALGALLACARIAWGQWRADPAQRSRGWRVAALLVAQPLCAVLLFFALWPPSRISESSTCSGVAPTRRAICTSVLILFGMRFRSPICSGRMSWRIAAVSVITLTPSFTRVSNAGSVSGILMGMGNTRVRTSGTKKPATTRSLPARFACACTAL